MDTGISGSILLDRSQDRLHLDAAALSVGAVFQVDGYHAKGPAADIQLCVYRQPPADAPLAVKVPIVLLRQTDNARPLDGPAGEYGISVEALFILVVYQLDELQSPGVVQPKASASSRAVFLFPDRAQPSSSSFARITSKGWISGQSRRNSWISRK